MSPSPEAVQRDGQTRRFRHQSPVVEPLAHPLSCVAAAKLLNPSVPPILSQVGFPRSRARGKTHGLLRMSFQQNLVREREGQGFRLGPRFSLAPGELWSCPSRGAQGGLSAGPHGGKPGEAHFQALQLLDVRAGSPQTGKGVPGYLGGGPHRPLESLFCERVGAGSADSRSGTCYED